MSKADYVRSQVQNRDHHCHWPGCTRQVPPAMWGCKAHWFQLPAELRRRIWRCYQPGQEINGRPSAEYVAVAREAQAWITTQQLRPSAPDLFAAIDRGPAGDWPSAHELSPWTHADGRED